MRARRRRGQCSREQRATAPHASWRVRGRPHRCPTHRPLSRRREGVRPDGGPQPRRRRRDVGVRRMGRPRARGHRGRCRHQGSPRHPRASDRSVGRARDPAIRWRAGHVTTEDPARPRCRRRREDAARSRSAGAGAAPDHHPPIGRGTAALRPTSGVRRLARIIATGPAPTRSELENVVLDLLLDGGFAHPDVNRPLWLDGRKVTPDFRWAAERLVVEADGAAWHDNPLAREEDAERQALLEAHGERVVRVTWTQAVARPTQTLARLRAAGVPHRASGSSG